MEDKLDTLDSRIDEIAGRQHGVATLRQLEGVGLGRRGVAKRAKNGRLHLSHVSAAVLWELLRPIEGPVHISVGRWTVDFLWRDQKVVVEIDSWTYHRGSVAFEDDHARDLDLRSAGYTVLRFDARQLEKEPGRVAADIARALAQEGYSMR